MKKSIISLLFALLFPVLLLHAAEEGQLSEGMENPGYVTKPDWFKISFLDLQEDLAEANAANKRVLLYFYQDGCPYCEKLIKVNWRNPDIVKNTRDNFDVIDINMWGDRELTFFDGKSMTEKQLAEQLKVMYTPTLLFFNEEGQQVLRINGYYPEAKFNAALNYVAEKKENKLSFSEYYSDQNKGTGSAKLHKSPQYLKPPYKLAAKQRNSGKPLLVIFEERWCKSCDELHNDILMRPVSQELLHKFDVVVLDRWGKDKVETPDGKTVTALQWAQQLDIKYAPSMIFFDSSNKEVFRTEAYLKSFHVQSVMDYVSSGAYKTQPNLQRYIQSRADKIREHGGEVDLWK
jgi:thioredoxin-related protein